MIAKGKMAVRRRDSRLVGGSRDTLRTLTPSIHHQLSFINSRGFTLIELLVVIAIIALLMAILFPSLSRVRRQAKAMICQTKLRQWGMTLNMYAQDNEGRFPTGPYAGDWLLRGTLISVMSEDPNAPQDSLHHFRTKDIACCPMATRSLVPDPSKFSANGSLPASFAYPPAVDYGIPGSEFPAWVMILPSPPLVGSYGVNQWLFLGGFGRLSVDVNIFALKGKGDIPVVLDSVAPSGRLLPSPPLTEVGAGNFFCINRHDRCVNGLFLDWSVRRIGLKELWTLKWRKDFDTNGRWTKAGGVRAEDWPKWMRSFKD